MIVDSSALLAILFGEPDAGRYERAIANAPQCRILAASLLESTIVVESRAGVVGGHQLDVLLDRGPIEVVQSLPSKHRPHDGLGGDSAREIIPQA